MLSVDGSKLELSVADNNEEFGVEVVGPLSDGSESILTAHSGAFFLGFAFEGEHNTRRNCWKEGVFLLARRLVCRASNFFISLFRPAKQNKY